MSSTDPGPGYQAGDTAIPSTLGQLGVNAPVCRASDLLGSHRTVDTLVQRDAIPATYRDEGMTVWVTAAATTYRLVGGILNANWTVDATGGAGALTRDYTGSVALRDVVYETGVADQVDRADASAAGTGRVLGVVSLMDTPGAGQCQVVQAGDIAGYTGLTPGAHYILAAAPGALVPDSGGANFPDTTPGSGEVFSPVGIAKSTTELAVQPGAGIVAEF